MKPANNSPIAMGRIFWIYRELIFSLALRDVMGRYKGSLFGVFWSLINPVMMLLVYTLFFGVIFTPKWNAAQNDTKHFALILFSGLIVFNLFSECITKSPSLLVNNANFIKKVVFPLEVLSIAVVAAALFHFAIGLLVWLLFSFFVLGPPNPQVVLLPIILLPLSLMLVGASWIMGTLGVFLRDLSQVANIAVTIAMFACPVFYPLSAIPEKYRFLLYLNPVTWPVENTRNLLIHGAMPDWIGFATYSLFCLLVLYAGFFVLQKMRGVFADVV